VLLAAAPKVTLRVLLDIFASFVDTAMRCIVYKFGATLPERIFRKASANFLRLFPVGLTYALSGASAVFRFACEYRPFAFRLLASFAAALAASVHAMVNLPVYAHQRFQK